MAERLVELWHSSPLPLVALHEAMGLTWDEYRQFVERSGVWSA
jgi:hypothetical protein